MGVLTQEWALPQINVTRCTLCGTCVEQCPGHAVEMTANGPSFVRPLDCTYCAVCEDACPESAITCTYVIVWDSEPQGRQERKARDRHPVQKPGFQPKKPGFRTDSCVGPQSSQ